MNSLAVCKSPSYYDKEEIEFLNLVSGKTAYLPELNYDAYTALLRTIGSDISPSSCFIQALYKEYHSATENFLFGRLSALYRAHQSDPSRTEKQEVIEEIGLVAKLLACANVSVDKDSKERGQLLDLRVWMESQRNSENCSWWDTLDELWYWTSTDGDFTSCTDLAVGVSQPLAAVKLYLNTQTEQTALSSPSHE